MTTPVQTTTTTTWVSDPAHTQVEFSAKHMMISTVRGRFDTFNGTAQINEANPTQSTVEGTIDAASLSTNQAQRDGHLRSADFFDTDKHPQISFKSTKVEIVKPNHYKLTGDLTIRGTTKPITFDVTDEGHGKDPYGNEKWGFSAETKFNRKDWGLNWNVALEAGGWLVGDEIKVFIETQLMTEAAAQAMMAAMAARSNAN